ncbi:hypothetical protein HanLR1_Chr17g0681791 [Helianthus annuus]|nr:hypothetical protein HanLR1_Chr17g0681791 [Helianthus annuus]
MLENRNAQLTSICLQQHILKKISPGMNFFFFLKSNGITKKHHGSKRNTQSSSDCTKILSYNNSLFYTHYKVV